MLWLSNEESCLACLSSSRVDILLYPYDDEDDDDEELINFYDILV